MSDIKLFRLTAGNVAELQGDASDLEKPLQTLLEANLQPLLNIRFLASEYSTGKTHGGRIDSLGLDENHCPVILEYKRSVAENVINQGLFYLDWLMDHQAEFKLLVMLKLGNPAADAIDWSAPRLVCIAADFTKYDGHAVQQIDRNIELIRYRRFGEELLLLELANASSASSKSLSAKAGKAGAKVAVAVAGNPAVAKPNGDKSYAEILPTLSAPLAELLISLEDYVLSLGDDVQRKELKLYVAFKRLKNFATVVLQKNRLLLYLHLPPAEWVSKLPNARDVSQQGHWGTGDVEISLSTPAELDAAKTLILAAYEGKAAPFHPIPMAAPNSAFDDDQSS
jgi:predicted transport protein